MTPQNFDKESELAKREQELRERELQIRMRELESEVNPPPFYATKKDNPPVTKFAKWSHRFITGLKFTGIVIVTVAVVKFISWIAGIVMVLAIAWLVYKIFFEAETKE